MTDLLTAPLVIMLEYAAMVALTAAVGLPLYYGGCRLFGVERWQHALAVGAFILLAAGLLYVVGVIAWTVITGK